MEVKRNGGGMFPRRLSSSRLAFESRDSYNFKFPPAAIVRLPLIPSLNFLLRSRVALRHALLSLFYVSRNRNQHALG